MFLLRFSSVYVLVTLHPLVCLKSLPQQQKEEKDTPTTHNSKKNHVEARGWLREILVSSNVEATLARWNLKHLVMRVLVFQTVLRQLSCSGCCSCCCCQLLSIIGVATPILIAPVSHLNISFIMIWLAIFPFIIPPALPPKGRVFQIFDRAKQLELNYAAMLCSCESWAFMIDMVVKGWCSIVFKF